jgi:pimeloyl-ACP methyl ester carboxylesterase
MSEAEYLYNPKTQLYFYKSGQGQAILLIHGTGFDGSVWIRLSPYLNDHYTVYAIDRNGFGRSAVKQVESRNYLQQQAVDIFEFIENEIKEPTILLGWSSGAFYAFQAAINDKKNLIKQIVSYEAPYLVSSNSDFKSIFQYVKVIIHQSSGNVSKAAETFIRLVLQKSDHTNSFDDLDDEIKKSIKLNANAALIEIKSRTGENIDKVLLRSLSIKIDFVTGQLSPVFIKKANSRLARIFRTSQWVQIDGSGHFAFYEKPAEFSKALRNLID